MGEVSLFPPRPLLLPPVLPSEDDLRAEQGLIGCLLMNPAKAIARLPSTFSSDHYADEQHRAIHDVIVEIGVGANPISIRAALGGDAPEASYLADLMVNAVGWMATPDLAHTVTEACHRRQISTIINDVQIQMGLGSRDAPAAGIANMVIARLDALTSNTRQYGAGVSLSAALDAALAGAEAAMKGEAVAGRSTGMPSVDDVMGGLEKATFNVLGARPGMGKTALAVQWAMNIARACKAEGRGGVLGFSLEMSATQLARRVLAEATKISVVDLKRGRIEGRLGQITRVHGDLLGLPVWIEDAGGQNILAIRQKARAAQRRFGSLALIWLDHIQIVKPDEADRKNGGTQAVGRISNALRDLSKEFDCPVLCLSQLSRGLLARDDKRPNLGDLRQAGDIEQDADTIAFLHREEVFLPKSAPEQNAGEAAEKWQQRVRAYDEMKERTKGKAELIFEKLRDGNPCSVDLRFHGQTTSFSEFDNAPVPSGGRAQKLQDWADSREEPPGLWPT